MAALHSCGAIRRLADLTPGLSRKFLCEYFDVRCAQACLQLLPSIFANVTVTQVRRSTSLTRPLTVVSPQLGQPEIPVSPIGTGRQTTPKTSRDAASGETVQMSGPSSASTDPSSTATDPSTGPPTGQSTASTAPSSDPSTPSDETSELGAITRDPVPWSNVIDLSRVERGLDTRATLMIRNIPNRVSQQDLKEYIDVTSKKTYDFLCMWNSIRIRQLF